MVFDAKVQYASRWAAIKSIVGASGVKGETRRKCVRQGEHDSRARPGQATEQQRIKHLERQVRELPKTNEFLRLASAYLPQVEFNRQLNK